jgi:hypothetical protein
VNSQTLRVAWYGFRATFRLRWGGYMAIVLLIALLGGVAMGAIAGARRTQSSFPVYLASTNPSELGGIVSVLNPAIGGDAGSGYDPKLIATIAHLPYVRNVESSVGLDVLPLGPLGARIDKAFVVAAGNGQGSPDGLNFNQDRLSVVQGRMADPRRPGEIVMANQVVKQLDLHVGERIPIGVYTNAQTNLAAFGTSKVRPIRRIVVTLVGTVLEPRQLIEDDVDNSQSLAYFTPAFTRAFVSCCVNYSIVGIQVRGGHVPAVERELRAVLPKGFPAVSGVADVLGKAQRAIKPESIALGVFGAIAALAALLIAVQVIGRQVRLGTDETETLRALGADQAMTSSEALIGILGAVVVGSLLAAGVAVALSPLAPLGPVRPVYPDPGVSFDWTVLGVGVAVLVVGLGAAAAALVVRASPHRTVGRRWRGARGSGAARAAANSGMPVPAVVGIRFALEPGAGRNAVPVRSAILGTVLAVVVVVAAVTFGDSLDTLVSHPDLYGWNWSTALASGNVIPEQHATELLSRDRYVRAFSGAYFDDLSIAGQTVPVMGQRPGSAVQPPILTGHSLQGPDQVVLGAVTLAQLHKRLGDTVQVTSAAGPARPLTIVGTATMPTIGNGSGPHLEMGTGALIPAALIPAPAKNPFNVPAAVAGPAVIFIDLKPGSDAAGLRSLQKMTGPLTNQFNFGVFISPVLHPAEIVNYRSMGTTPAILGAALGAGAAAALALTLVASVRRRRRDLALLKTIGLSRRQLGAVVAWQSSVAVAIGTAVGVPLGIVVGRSLWQLFANEIHAVPTPSVPALSIAIIAAGALVLANVIAFFPGRIAARTPTALLLRAE